MLKNKFITYHVIPFIFALVFILIFIFSIYSKNKNSSIQIIEILEINDSSFKSRISTLSDSSYKLAFVNSFIDTGIFLFIGSSELSSHSIYNSYKYFEDTLRIKSCAIGKGYHQSFSIFSRLLSMEPFLKNKKMCILLSPGWFQNKGTNTQAFFQSIDLDFLTQIYFNPNIKDKYKTYLGKYLDEHSKDITANAPIISKFINQYRKNSRNNKKIIDKAISYLESPIVNYFHNQFKYKKYKKKKTEKKEEKINSIKKYNYTPLKDEFIAKYKNTLFVNTEYYKKYLIDKKGKVKLGKIPFPNLQHNNELEDLKILLQLIKEKNINASFVMQPLNPYFYTNTSILLPLMDSVSHLIQQYHFPYLDLYPKNKDDYEPGTLSDIMHLGDYGWMKINRFIYEEYYK